MVFTVKVVLEADNRIVQESFQTYFIQEQADQIAQVLKYFLHNFKILKAGAPPSYKHIILMQ